MSILEQLFFVDPKVFLLLVSMFVFFSSCCWCVGSHSDFDFFLREFVCLFECFSILLYKQKQENKSGKRIPQNNNHHFMNSVVVKHVFFVFVFRHNGKTLWKNIKVKISFHMTEFVVVCLLW